MSRSIPAEHEWIRDAIIDALLLLGIPNHRTARLIHIRSSYVTYRAWLLNLPPSRFLGHHPNSIAALNRGYIKHERPIGQDLLSANARFSSLMKGHRP